MVERRIRCQRVGCIVNYLHLLRTLEDIDNFHLGRLLVLLRAFAGASGADSVDGLTKLAKLDFLLRYPALLERALHARGAKAADVQVLNHERTSVESRMVRFRYGPWDFRYRRFINLLVGMGLVRVELDGRTIRLSLTTKGVDLSGLISKTPSFADVDRRAQLLKRHCDLSATNLMRFVYETFPEIASLRLGEEIAL